MQDDEIKIKVVESIQEIKIFLKIQKGDGFKHSYYLTQARLRELFENREVFLKVVFGQKIIGFVSFKYETKTRARLQFLSILSKYQRTGVGKRLLERIVNITKKRGVQLLYFISEEKAEGMGIFLEKFGFQKAGFHKNRFGDNKHAIFFNLKI